MLAFTCSLELELGPFCGAELGQKLAIERTTYAQLMRATTRGTPEARQRNLSDENSEGGSRPRVLLDILDVEEILSRSFSVTRFGDLLQC